jgi:glycosyltransferase involved in cell wall biosynthesis
MSIRNRITFDEALPKRVSYIVATKNRATPYLKNVLIFLKDIISSRDEIIVVDGFSSDNSREIIDEFIDIIDVFISEPDMNLIGKWSIHKNYT